MDRPTPPIPDMTSRLVDLLHDAPAAFAILTGPDHRYVLANAAYQRILGQTRDIVGRTVHEVFGGDSIPAVWTVLDTVFRTGEPYRGLPWPADINGEQCWYTFAYLPTRDNRGTIDGIFIQAIDVTDQVIARQAAEAAAERTRLLQQLTAALTTARTTAEVAVAVTAIAVPAIGSSGGSVRVRSDDGQFLDLAGSTGQFGPRATPRTRVPLREDSPFSPIVLGGQAVWFERLADLHGRYPALAIGTSTGNAAFAGLPLVVDGTVIGALGFAFPVERRFNADDRTLFLAIAQLCAQAIERTRLDERVRANQTHLQLATDAAAIGTWEWHVQTGDLIWSATHKALWGYAPDQPVAYDDWARIVEPVDLPRVEQAIERALRGEAEYDVEYQVRPAGEPRWIRSIGRTRHDGLTTILRGVSFDITDQKRADEQLRQSEARLRRLQELTSRLADTESLADVRRIIVTEVVAALGAASGGLRRLTDAGLVIDELDPGAIVSDETLQRVGLVPIDAQHPAAEAVRSADAILIHDAAECMRRYPDLASIVIANGMQAVAHLPLKRGEEVFAILSLNFSGPRRWDEDERAFALALADRSAVAFERARLSEAEREAKRRLEETSAVLDQALGAAAIGMFDYRPGAGDPYVDGRLRAIFGLPADGPVSLRSLLLASDPDDRPAMEAAMARALDPANDGSYAAEYRIRRASDGQERWVLARGLIQRDGAGMPERYTILVVDMTDRMVGQARERALAAEQDARANAEAEVADRDRFLSVAAHELRTPVAGIRGFVDLLARQLAAPDLNRERLVRYSAAISEGASRLTTLTNTLLDVSRLQSSQFVLEPAIIDLATIVDRVVRDWRDRLPTHQLTASLTPIRMTGDAARLEQVFVNLLENAGKYAPDGGTIRVALDIEGDDALLTVRDDGIGIPPGEVDRVFLPFHRAANAQAVVAQGVGLGLHICRQIVERHGGTIQARANDDGPGTTFVVRLPRVDTPLTA